MMFNRPHARARSGRLPGCVVVALVGLLAAPLLGHPSARAASEPGLAPSLTPLPSPLSTEASTAGLTAVSATQTATPTATRPEALVDINAATEAQLAAGLPGIGPAKAAAIVAWREQFGRVTDPEQLLEVKGIGPRTLERLRPLLAPTSSESLEPARSALQRPVERAPEPSGRSRGKARKAIGGDEGAVGKTRAGASATRVDSATEAEVVAAIRALLAAARRDADAVAAGH